MKKSILLGLAFMALITLAVSCNKSNAKRIVGTWKVAKVIENSKDVTSDWIKNSYTETYGETDAYSYTGMPDGKSGTGKYTWNTETSLKRNGVSGQSSPTCTITLLDKSNLAYTMEDGGENWQFTFVKQ